MESIQLINLRRHVELTSRKRYKPPQETLSATSIDSVEMLRINSLCVVESLISMKSIFDFPAGESQPLCLYGSFNDSYEMVAISIVFEDDFDPTESFNLVLAEFEADVLLFVQGEIITVIHD